MVEWKGEITEENSGEKAALLDSIESLEVPNFFCITRSEMQALVHDKETREEVLNSEFPQELEERLEDAYDNIGVSSEVRESSDRARELVGGQRDAQKVSVRVSGGKKGIYDYKLNIGSSGLETAVKEVAASYVEKEDDAPAIIVQKMVEPERTGAVITSYLGNLGLVESVEGLGISLEEGITRPDLYLIEDGKVVEESYPEKQVKVTRHPINDEHRRRNISKKETGFSARKTENLYQDVKQEEADVKFVYKRGTFYVVDAFRNDSYNPFSSPEKSLEGVRASIGEIEGVVGRDIAYTEETAPPEKYGEAIVSRKGGYTSADAQRAREAEKPAIFGFRGELSEGEHVSIPANAVEPADEGNERTGQERESFSQQNVKTTAMEVLPIDGEGRSVNLRPPFRDGYAVTDREARSVRIPPSGFLTDYGDVFRFHGNRYVLDGRRLERDALPDAIEYLEADLQILLLDEPFPEVLRAAVEEDIDVIAARGNLERFEDAVEREERRFIIEKLREL